MSYLYDPDGTLIARTNNTTTVLMLGTDEITISSGTITQAIRYYPLPGAPTTVRETTTPTTSTLYYQAADPQATATATITASLTTTTRRIYAPFGDLRANPPGSAPKASSPACETPPPA